MKQIKITLDIIAHTAGRIKRDVTVNDSITFGQLADRIEQEVINSTQLDYIQGVTYEEQGYILHRKLSQAGVGNGDSVKVTIR